MTNKLWERIKSFFWRNLPTIYVIFQITLIIIGVVVFAVTTYIKARAWLNWAGL